TLWYWASDAISTVVNTYDGLIDFGLMIYPGTNHCTDGVVEVDIGAGNASNIITSLTDPPPSGGNYTPMYQSLDVASGYAPLRDAASENFVILITDGWQWCDPYDATTRFNAVDSVATLYGLGIQTAVIGFYNSVDGVALHRMAVEGNMTRVGCDPTASSINDANRCYFQTDDGPSLEAVLDAIALEITAEICDGIDNNCDGNIDEGLFRSCSSACGSGIEQCVNGNWVNCTATETQEEICDDVDNDCDGVVDEGCSCVSGATRDCGIDIGACGLGYQVCTQGLWSECREATWPVEERCNNVDDDCDGFVDEDLVETCSSICGNGVRTCTGGTWSQCSAPAPTAEICNAQDDDCNGLIDDGVGLCESGFECIEGVCVDQNGNLPDAGVDSGDDSGTGDPGSGKAADGCSCSTPGVSGFASTGLLYILGLFGMLLFVRRRSL
ncbi:hypothetical protein KJ865_00155, partial [Myxococcota bacterium]|nr:hypothetical protein [Myxococcota bacterium]